MQCHSGGGDKESSGVESTTEPQEDPVQTKTKHENKNLQKCQDNKFFLEGTFTGTPALEIAAGEL